MYMKRIITIAILMVSFTTFAQTDAEYEVKYVVDYFFEGFHASDSLKMKSVMHKDITMQSIQPNKEGVDDIVYTNVDQFVDMVVQYAKVQNWEEELGKYSYHIDGSLAHVWAPYKFYVNGMMTHCGANSIQLLKDKKEGWKIISILDTRRKDCGD